MKMPKHILTLTYTKFTIHRTTKPIHKITHLRTIKTDTPHSPAKHQEELENY